MQHVRFARGFRQTERCCACRKTKPQSKTNPLLVCASLLALTLCVCARVCVAPVALSPVPSLQSQDRKKHVAPTPQGVSREWVGGGGGASVEPNIHQAVDWCYSSITSFEAYIIAYMSVS